MGGVLMDCFSAELQLLSVPAGRRHIDLLNATQGHGLAV